jgi:cellulose biosynthesis protein BcsQ
VKRDDAEAPSVAEARAYFDKLRIPVWGGQISHRASYAQALAAGAGAREWDPDSAAAAEVARLWSAIEKSIKAIRGAYEGRAMHKQVA